MTEDEFTKKMQSFIDQRDREIERLKDLVDSRTDYIRGLENDYSRLGLQGRRYRSALEGLIELVEMQDEANEVGTDLYTALAVAKLAINPEHAGDWLRPQEEPR